MEVCGDDITLKCIMHLPRLYPILDASCFPDGDVMFAAEELSAAGVTLLQYRNKSGNAHEMLDQARELKRRVGGRVKLIMNDRADLCLAVDFDGLHLGQDDLSPEASRRIIGPDRWLGVSTHNPKQLAEYRSGKDKLFGFFVGQTMKATQGKANPAQLNDLLKKKLAGP